MSYKKPSVEYELYIEGESVDGDKPSCHVCHKTFLNYPSRNQHVMTVHDVEHEKPLPECVIDVEEKYEAASQNKTRSLGVGASTRKTGHRSRCRLLRSSRKVGKCNPAPPSEDQIRPRRKPTPSNDVTLDCTVPCLESNCKSKFPHVQDLRNHLVIDHNFPLESEVKLNFPTLQEFENWKEDLEEEKQSRWIKHHTKTLKYHRVLIYDCAHMMKGRIHADVYCTSQIIVKAFKGGKKQLEVSYFARHYGHDHVHFSNKRKQSVANIETAEDNKTSLSISESGERINIIRCHLCNKRFVDERRRDKHIKNMHEKEEIPECPVGPIECLEPNCGKKFRVRRFLRQHLIREHNFEMHTGDTLHFSTLEEFENWKSKLEEDTQSFYKKRQRDTNKTYKLTIQYVCCRAGKMFNTDNRKRNLKIHGSRRSNIHCTSEIKLRYLDVGYEVSYFRDHYGHDNSLVHLPVPKKLKEEIAEPAPNNHPNFCELCLSETEELLFHDIHVCACSVFITDPVATKFIEILLEPAQEKLMAGQGITSIVRELRMKSGDQLNRKHLIRKKDVINIKTSYAIKIPKEGRVVTKEISNIDTWVRLTKASSDGVIIFYKPEGYAFEELEENEFLAVCMTPFQKEMAIKFGGDRICVDSTYDDESAIEQVCELTTILVVNEYEEGIPVAFCISSRVNMPVLRRFFSTVKEVIGSVHCHTFVATETPQFYDAWCGIMETPSCHIMSAWHVNAAWRSRLRRIVNTNQSSWIYERLKACQLQCDINEFTEMLKSLLNDLELSEEEFCVYIKEYYAHRPEMWATAHRIGIKINTNLYPDNFHHIIKRNFVLGKEKRKIEKCISAINDYILDREYDQLIEYCKRKVLSKLNYIMDRHEAGTSLVSSVAEIIESSCWAVSSPSQHGMYVVNRVESHSCAASCTIYCQECMACLKGCTCSCDDNAIQGNVCEHLHAVAEYRKSQEKEIQYVVIEGNENALMHEGEAIVDHEMIDEKCIEVNEEDPSSVNDESDQDFSMIYNDDLTIKCNLTGDRKRSGLPLAVALVKEDFKGELLSGATQLMNELTEFQGAVSRNVGNQIKLHIEKARKLLQGLKSKKCLARSKVGT